jgi:hypothetical protein
MKKIVNIFILPAFIFYGSNMFSQPDSVKYTSEFNFVEGIYFSFDDFKRNEPSIKGDAIISTKSTYRLLYDSYDKADYIAYYDVLGNKQKLKRNEVWGYCINGVIYVLYGRNFYRISKIGSICLFENLHDNIGREIGYNIAGATNPYIPSPESAMYMMEFKTGNKMQFNLENFLMLLKTDNELYIEFTSIKDNIKKQEQMFIYLIKFNERNPVYFKTN